MRRSRTVRFRDAGLAFAVHMLNGHNTAQAESLPDTFRGRMRWWLNGSQVEPRWKRIAQLLRSGRIRRTWRQIRRWKHSALGERPVTPLDENLVVGWFPAPVVSDPRSEGDAFVMHALGPENGELWVVGQGLCRRLLRGVQNLPLYFVAVIRDGGTIYYVLSIDGATALPCYPAMRPIAVGPMPDAEQLYLGVHQSVLGQIGWRIDTRVAGARVAKLPGFGSWSAGSHAAERLQSIPQDGQDAEVGGAWEIVPGVLQGENSGLGPTTLAVLDPGKTSGLIHLEHIDAGGAPIAAGLAWRCRDDRNHWQLVPKDGGYEMAVVENGHRQVVASKTMACRVRSLQILDDGRHVMAYLNGLPLSEGWIVDVRLSEATKVGLLFDASGTKSIGSHLFEAHPRQMHLPKPFMMGIPEVREGTYEVVADDFSGTVGDLEGRETPVGGKRWTRLIGKGVIEVSGNGSARVRASVSQPCPGRTVYCVDWPNENFVDVEVTITPPEAGQTTAGFTLYQDPDNYFTLNAYSANYYPGASVSCFFKVDGFEDVYDAVWTNVADRITFGRPSRLRLRCDGERYLASIDDEAVLFRAFSDVYPGFKRLLIRKVGLLANWEFGTDTGSKFEQCRMRI